MRYFIGVRVPPDFKKIIEDFCKRHQCVIQDPHVTVISPGLLEGVVGVEHKLQSFCLAQADFKLTIAGANCHNDQMLYLTVLPGNINFAREKLMQYFKLPKDDQIYRPHLKLIQQTTARNFDFNTILEDARNVFTNTVSFSVEAFTLFAKQENSAYKVHMEVPFTGR